LIGDYDYYRIVQHGAGAKLAVFNFNGSLNSSALKEPTVHLRKLELPKRIVDLEFARTESGMTSSTTLILMCDSGWQISFRLHNAEKIVQPSLKFDIKLLRTPDSLQVFSVQN
jgi:hypothetical protein